jgi:hypothetical protein
MGQQMPPMMGQMPQNQMTANVAPVEQLNQPNPAMAGVM